MAFLRAAVGPDEADDCFQETFIAALRAYPRLADGRNLRGWVLKIAQRKAIDLHRARRSNAQMPMPVEERPEEPRAGGEEMAGLWLAARALPSKQRVAIAHRFVADLPYRDIARLMDSSEAAARRNVHEGLKRMRKELE